MELNSGFKVIKLKKVTSQSPLPLRERVRVRGEIKSLPKPSRLHSFDAFRAMLAIFGVILHAYYFFLIFKVKIGTFDEAILGVHSTSTDFFTIFCLWIHSFRMPAFFAISGFFSFYLFTKIGLKSTLMNRCKRILIPFLVLWLVPLIFMLIKILINHATLPEIKQYLNVNQITYVGTFWFLYFLIIMDAILLLFFIPVFRRNLPIKAASTDLKNRNMAGATFISRFLSRIQSKPSIITGLIIGSIACTLVSQNWFTPTSISLIPVPSTLIYYGLFFAFGCVMASNLSLLSTKLRKLWPIGLSFSLMLIGIYWFLFSHFHENAIAKLSGEVIWGILPWLMIVTLFFCFESLASKPNKIWRYLGDSTYWIYIAQMPIIMVLSLIFFTGKPILFVAVPSVVVITLAILLISYQLLIRKRRYLNYIDGARSK